MTEPTTEGRDGGSADGVTPLRVLVVAFAYGPLVGSEPGQSWAWASAAAQVAEVDVLTTSRYRAEIEGAEVLSGSGVKRVFYVDPPRFALERWLHLPGYWVWKGRASKKVAELQCEQPYDLVHHVSYGNMWLGAVGRTSGTPFVAGPLNGGPRVPPALFPALGLRGGLREGIRQLVQLSRSVWPSTRRDWSRADSVLVANFETLERLPRNVRGRARVHLQNIETPAMTRALETVRSIGLGPVEPNSLLAAGRLLPWKGFALAVRAMLYLPDWHLTIVGRGPDERRLARVARRLGVADRVTVRSWLHPEDFLRLMSQSRVIVVPSLRDDGPSVLTEALMLGRPVVALDQGAARYLSGLAGVTAIRPGAVPATAQRLADAILEAPLTADSQLRDLRWEALPPLLADVYAGALQGDTDEVPSVDYVREAVLDLGKRVGKRAAGPMFGATRSLGLFGLARGATDAGETFRYHRPAGSMDAHRVDLAEPARSISTLGAGGPVSQPRPVTTVVTLLDAGRGVLTFRNNHVVDDRGLIVRERVTDTKGKEMPLVELRAGRAPLEEPRRISGSVGYLSNSGIGNFGHWLVFALPLVQHYREHLGHDPDYYYVGTPVHDWHYDSLAAIGIERDRVVTYAVSADRMLAAIADDHLPPPTPYLDFVTNALRKPRDSRVPGRRIYISRALRPRRRLLNEAECLEVLGQHGFDAVRTEELTLQEETQLFADAELVVGAHGAGFANLLFCHPGCVMIEFFPYGFATDWFDETWPGVELSAARGVTYANLYGEGVFAWGMRRRDHPLLIDPEKLDSLLEVATRTAARNRRVTDNPVSVRNFGE